MANHGNLASGYRLPIVKIILPNFKLFMKYTAYTEYSQMYPCLTDTMYIGSW